MTTAAETQTTSWGASTLPTSVTSSRMVDPTATTTTTAATTTATANLMNSNQTQKSIKELFYNGTGYYIEDEVDPGLNDLQTLLLACFATLIPLIISLLTAFGIRILWTKYRKQKEDPKYDGILDGADTQESISRPLHSHLINSDKKCGETHLAIDTDVVAVMDGSGLDQIRTNNHSNTNGSIITMTLKNNHLIVETEERNDIEEDSRETTMKYSPGARDGVFVVEVQQGVRRSPGPGGGGAPPSSGPDPERTPTPNDQCALVHDPPSSDKYSDEEGDDYVETTSPTSRNGDAEMLASQPGTGLAQSDSSLAGRPATYGYYSDQQGYCHNGAHGYDTYGGYVDEPVGNVNFKGFPVDQDKPKITAAIYKTLLKVEDEDQEEQARLGSHPQ